MKFTEFKKKVDEELKAAEEDGSSERARTFEAILDIVKLINQTLILNDVLDLVLKNAIKITDSERGFIVLRNSSGKLEYSLGITSEGEKLSQESFDVSTTVVDDVFATGRSRFIEGAQSDTNHDPSKSILKLDLQTILCSPLITEDKKIGVIYVDSKHLHKIKVTEITSTFEILAGQAAIAIRNAQLYNGQLNAYNALNEANVQLIQSERKALKSSIDSEIGQSLQGLVHLALLENESMMRIIEKAQKEFNNNTQQADLIFFDRLILKSRVATDSIRNIQKYAQALLETSVMNLNKDSGDLNKTIQSVIRYISPMKKFAGIVFKTEFNNISICSYDSEQIQHLLVNLFTNSADAKKDATISIKTSEQKNKVYVEVKDDGPGIPLNNFESLFGLPSTDKTGYGLFLCKSIIERHSGEIKIVNYDKGTAIQFWLPIK